MTSRRLDLYPARKLRGRARHERAFFAAMDGLDRWLPLATDRAFENAKLPVYQKAVSVRHGAPEFRRAVVVRLLDHAARLASRTPARVAAIIDWPGLWASELCVFHDADCAAGFDPERRAREMRPARTVWDGGWVEARDPSGNLLADLNLTLPAGFAAQGTEFAEYDSATAVLTEREEWVVMSFAPVQLPTSNCPTDQPSARSLP